MIGITKSAFGRALAALLAALLLASPAVAIDYEELMKLKKQFEIVRDLVRKLRGREPAPAPPSPPAQTPAPEGSGTPVAGMNFKGSCVAKDETGYAENAQVNVVDGKVTQMAVRITVPKRGSCSYQLAAFKQTKQTPYVELAANSDASCSIRMWQQTDRVTVAATDCSAKCTPGAFDYAWPVEMNTTGGCH